MNLARHAEVLWRFRRVAVAGLALGVVLAFLASYRIGFDGITARGQEEWTAVSSILVTQPGFPEGRVVLPQPEIPGSVAAGQVEKPKDDDQVEFADPDRLSSLADLYSRFLTSDGVLARVPERPSASQVEASPFSASASGQILPVIQLTVRDSSQDGAALLNRHIFESLRRSIEEQQTSNDIGQSKRIELSLIDVPAPTLTSPIKHTVGILLFVLCLLGTLAVVHLLEGLRPEESGDLEPYLADWEDVAAGVDPDREATAFNGRRVRRRYRFLGERLMK